MKKRRLTYVVPKLPFKGSHYNGIQKLVDLIVPMIQEQYVLSVIPMKFLELGIIKKQVAKVGNTILSRSIINRDDFGISASQQQAIELSDIVHFWHPEFPLLFPNTNYIVSSYGIELYQGVIEQTGTNFIPSVFSNARIIHAVSESTKEQIFKLMELNTPGRPPNIESKVRVLYPFIDTNQYFAIRRRKPRSKIIIGTLCRLFEEKNVINIIRSLPLLRDNYNVDFHYLLAGDGPLKNECLDVLRDLEVPFTYLGEVTESEKIHNFFRNVQVFISPSNPIVNEEGIGIAYMEASASNTPFVTSKRDSWPEDKSLPGVYANYRSPRDIAIKTKHIIDNSQYYKNKTKKWVNSFSINRSAPIIEEWYRLLE